LTAAARESGLPFFLSFVSYRMSSGSRSIAASQLYVRDQRATRTQIVVSRFAGGEPRTIGEADGFATAADVIRRAFRCRARLLRVVVARASVALAVRPPVHAIRPSGLSTVGRRHYDL